MMKKILTILFTIFILASGIQITLDRHYCGGQLADIKISVTGKMASCGMEQSESGCPAHQTIKNKCCEDKITCYGINNNYVPEYYKLTHPVNEKKFLPIYLCSFIYSTSYNSVLTDWVLPPGENIRSGPTQPEICIYRI